MEDDVEDPVEPIFDVPMASDGAGEELGVEGHRGEKIAAFAADAAIAFDLGLNHGDGLEAREARLPGEAPVRGQPSHVAADEVPPLFDAPVIGVEGFEAVETGRIGLLEAAFDLARQAGPVSLTASR